MIVDHKRKIKTSIELFTKDGNEVDFQELVLKISKKIEGAVKSEENSRVTTHAYPLVSEILIPAIMGISEMTEMKAVSMVADNRLTYCFLHVMLVAMNVGTYINKHELKIVTKEEPIDEEKL